MSKNNKPRQSEPARASSSAKTSARSVSASTGKATPKFYDGPTVRRSDSPKQPAAAKSKALVKKPVKPKRAGWSIWALITFIPFILFCSLFSTVLCPPHTAEPSFFSRLARNALGKTEHHTLHDTICYPAYVYHDRVLQPYVYPVLTDVRAQLERQPIYKERIEPGVKYAKASANRVWNGPIKPVVNRIARGARKFHLSHIQPRLPYLKAKVTEATAPIITRVKAFYAKYAAKHVKTTKSYACAGVKHAKQTYRTVAAHPYTAQAGKHGQTAFRIGKQQSHKAYKVAKPHALHVWQLTHHHTQHTVFPRLVQAIQLLLEHVGRALSSVNSHLRLLYKQHAAKHLDPYINQACKVVSPYTSTFNAKIYQPHVKPFIQKIFPGAVPQKSFWSYMADWAPTMGATHMAEDRGQQIFGDKKEREKKVEKVKENLKKVVTGDKEAKKAKADKPKQSSSSSQKPKETKTASSETKVKATTASSEKPKSTITPEELGNLEQVKIDEAKEVLVEKAIEVAESASSAAYEPEATPAVQDHKADVESTLAQLKKKLDFQGKAGLGRIQDEALNLGEKLLETLPEMSQIGVDNIDREGQRMVKGLDRLYTTSKSLTRGQVAESSQMADDKVGKQVAKAKDGISRLRKVVIEDPLQPHSKTAVTELEKLLGSEYEALGKKMSIVDGVTQKEWDTYKGLKKDVESWKSKYDEAAKKPGTRQLKEQDKAIDIALKEVQTAYNDMFETFRDNISKLKKVALERIDAREAMEQDAKQAPVRAGGKKKSAEDGRVSILPIKEEDPQAARGGSPIIGKSQEQVEDALKQANAAAEKEKAKITARAEL